MSYLDRIQGLAMGRRRRATRSGERAERVEGLMSLSNNLYVRHRLEECVEVLKEAICLNPRNPRPYYTLGLILEEKKMDLEAYNCFLISAQLQKKNYMLWTKLYHYARRLGLDKERVEFIEVLQAKENSREMVMEKLEFYRAVDDIYRELSARIELFEFDGADDSIFSTIREKIGHKSKMGVLAKKLGTYLSRDPARCSDFFVEQLIMLRLAASEFSGLKSIFDSYLLVRPNTAFGMALRMTYVIASLRDPKADRSTNSEYSDVGVLLDDERWEDFRDFDLVKELVDACVEKGLIEESLRVLLRAEKVFYERREYIYGRIGKIYEENGRQDEALRYYSKVLEIHPANDMVKADMYRICMQMGNYDMAREYETINQLVAIVSSMENDDKDRYRYTPEKCREMRMLYDRSMELMKEDLNEFMGLNQTLLDDFMKNEFVFVRKKNFRNLNTRNRKVSMEEINAMLPMLPASPEASNKVLYEHSIQLAALHGLEVEEWFGVVVNQVFSLLSLCKKEEALSLLFKSFDAHIFASRHDLMAKLVFVGLKISLMFGDLSEFVMCIRQLIYITRNMSYAYLLFYFTSFFVDFHKNSEFCLFQAYLQKVCRRKLEVGHESEEDEASRAGRTQLTHAVLSSQSRGISFFLLLNSSIPNYLRPKTVELIALHAGLRHSIPECIILSAMLLTHSKSRRVSDRTMFIRRAIEMLKDKDGPAISYNLGRAYHFFGLYGFAEKYYLEAVATSNLELKRLAQFNLSLIYRKNNSRELLDDVLGR
jgi:general transcription factor 3C polypeptide 3 (transcription factor C subunit 4)